MGKPTVSREAAWGRHVAGGELSSCHMLVSSRFGRVGIEWYEDARGPRVCRIFLPSELEGGPAYLSRRFSNANRRSCASIDELAERIRALCAGRAVAFDLALLDLDRCPVFQRKVLRAEAGIPRGRVSSYGRVARHIGRPGAARAAGNALGANPFPLVIPCHRAVRENGELGGYRGGIAMKRSLLELEGIEFSAVGRVVTDAFFY